MTVRISQTFLRNARAWAPVGRAGWPVALFAFVVALLIRMALQPVLDDECPLLFFSIAVLIVHYRYGLGPALLVALLGLPAGDYFFVAPYQTFGWPEWEDVADIVYNVASTICFMVLIQQLRRARYESALLAEVSESRYQMLLDSTDRSASRTF